MKVFSKDGHLATFASQRECLYVLPAMARILGRTLWVQAPERNITLADLPRGCSFGHAKVPIREELETTSDTTCIIARP